MPQLTPPQAHQADLARLEAMAREAQIEPTPAQIEAAARASWGVHASIPWDQIPQDWKLSYRDRARAALRAAATSSGSASRPVPTKSPTETDGIEAPRTNRQQRFELVKAVLSTITERYSDIKTADLRRLAVRCTAIADAVLAELEKDPMVQQEVERLLAQTRFKINPMEVRLHTLPAAQQVVAIVDALRAAHVDGSGSLAWADDGSTYVNFRVNNIDGAFVNNQFVFTINGAGDVVDFYPSRPGRLPTDPVVIVEWIRGVIVEQGCPTRLSHEACLKQHLAEVGLKEIG